MVDFTTTPYTLGAVTIKDPVTTERAQVVDGALQVGGTMAANVDQVGGIDVGEDGLRVVPQISTAAAGGPLIHPIVSAGTPSPVLVAGAAGAKKLIEIFVSNSHSAAQYLHFYDTDVTPVVGTTVPRITCVVPAGWGGTIPLGCPKLFELGLGFAITGGAGNLDSTNPTTDRVHGELSYIEAV